jgi:hypothetical protein
MEDERIPMPRIASGTGDGEAAQSQIALAPDRFEKFAAEALAGMGCEGLMKLLQSAPPTTDQEEIALREACWKAVLAECPLTVA